MPSLAQMEWWFRSQKSGRLNFFSYGLLGLLLAVPVYLGLGLALQAISQMWSAAEEADWINGRPPRALNLGRPASQTGPSFPQQRKSLIETIRYRNDPEPEAPLRAAENAASQCGLAADSFGTAEIHVYPGCVTYAVPPSTTKPAKDRGPGEGLALGVLRKERKLTDVEQLVFRRFAAFITKAFQDTALKRSDKDHTERRLARTLGLSDAITTSKPLDVPWIYIASQEGAIAVFPGTNVIAENFDTKSRPWYMATFSGKKPLWCDVPDPNDRLSVTYLDVLAESSILVRTYLSTFSLNGQDFVMGIDLTRRGESLGRTAAFVPGDPAWTAPPRRVRLGISLVLSLATLAILRWMSMATTRCFCFERSKWLYGIVEAKEETRITHGSGESTRQEVFARAGNRTGVKAGKVWDVTQSEDHKHTAEASRPLRRGQELWNVAYNKRVAWHLFGLRFESVSRARIGRIQLVYTSAILPEAEWEIFSPGPFSEAEAQEPKARLPEILRRNADGADDGRLEIPEDADPGRILGLLPRVPDFVAQIVPNPQELLAFRQRRVYMSLTSNALQDMYSKADLVRAVILQSYFERILETGKIDFLLRGRIVRRLLAFPDKQAQLNLTEKSRAVYQEFLDAFGTPARVLRRVDSPIAIDGTLVPVYDFAIIKDSEGERVFVAHAVSEISTIDIASPRRTTQAYRVDGYLSWRTSDVQFYAELFDRLARDSKDIIAPDQAEVSVPVVEAETLVTGN